MRINNPEASSEYISVNCREKMKAAMEKWVEDQCQTIKEIRETAMTGERTGLQTGRGGLGVTCKTCSPLLKQN